MRILMLAQFYPPMIGGEERHVRNLSLELVARGHDVTVATLWQEGLPEFECDQGVRVFRIRGLLQRVSSLFKEKERRHSPPFPDPEALWALRRIIMRERPHIVHAHNWMVHSFTPLKAWSKAKLVVTLHDCSLVCAKQQFVYQGALCSGPGLTKCLGCASENYGMAKGMPITLSIRAWGKMEQQTVDMFLPVSSAIAEANQLAKRGISYRVIPNFIPNDVDVGSDDTDPLREQLPQGNYLLFVGSVGHDKGVEVLLQAYAEMEGQVPLILIGQPEAGFSAAIPPGVRLLQSWPHSAVMSAWRRCTIALMPSICPDACPTVTMEAMAMGRAVVASHIGGLPDIVVDGKTGILIPPGDWRSLREAIQRLLDDPGLRERMGAMAKQRIFKFQARTVVPRIEQVYHEVLQSTKTSTRMKPDRSRKPEDTLATTTTGLF
jgi:glycosyltransferase involved in cell wall biosynthesis